MSFLCALPGYAIGIIIGVTVVQYAFALFCLMKLAYIDIEKREYVLWNVFILLAFFIGGIVFLIYYNKVKDEKRITPLGVQEQTPPPDEIENEKDPQLGDDDTPSAKE